LHVECEQLPDQGEAFAPDDGAGSVIRAYEPPSA
jgi:hypothetical protein